MTLRKFSEVQRQAAAEVVLRIVSAGLLVRDATADELARVVGVTRADLQEAIDRRAALKRRHANQKRGLGRRPNLAAPPGHKWCSGLPGKSGHYVIYDGMVRSASSPDGLYNKCRACHAQLEARRKAARRGEVLKH